MLSQLFSTSIEYHSHLVTKGLLFLEYPHSQCAALPVKHYKQLREDDLLMYKNAGFFLFFLLNYRGGILVDLNV